MKNKIRQILEKVAKNGTKGTSTSINERVMIQALAEIKEIRKKELINSKPKIQAILKKVQLRAYLGIVETIPQNKVAKDINKASLEIIETIMQRAEES